MTSDRVQRTAKKFDKTHFMFFSSLATVTRSIIRLRRKQRTIDVILPKNKSQKTKRGDRALQGQLRAASEQAMLLLSISLLPCRHLGELCCAHAEGLLEVGVGEIPEVRVTWRAHELGLAGVRVLMQPSGIAAGSV